MRKAQTRTVLRVKLRGRRKANNGTPGQELAEACSNLVASTLLGGYWLAPQEADPFDRTGYCPAREPVRPFSEPIETAVNSSELCPPRARNRQQPRRLTAFSAFFLPSFRDLFAGSSEMDGTAGHLGSPFVSRWLPMALFIGLQKKSRDESHSPQ